MVCLVYGTFKDRERKFISPSIRILFFAVVTGLAFFGCAGRADRMGGGERVLIHKVTSGETLEQIADDYYGDASRAAEIKRANALKDEQLAEGTVLQIAIRGKEMKYLELRMAAKTPYNAGLELAVKGSYLKAVAKFQAALAVDPRFTDARYNLGVTYQKMKAYDRAAEQFEDVVLLRPNRSKYHFALGSCFFYQGKYARAVKAFDRVIELAPGNLKARFSLAASLEKLGDADRARAAWKKYLELDNESEWAREARSRLDRLEK